MKHCQRVPAGLRILIPSWSSHPTAVSPHYHNPPWGEEPNEISPTPQQAEPGAGARAGLHPPWG